MRNIFLSLGAIAAAILLLVISIYLGQKAFTSILDFRNLERIPHSSILGSIEGEVQLRGRVEGKQLVSSPRSKTPCIYYKYVVKQKTRDSEGKVRWETIHNETRSKDFILLDNSGRAEVSVSHSFKPLKWTAEQKYYREQGDYRYTEWRVDPDDYITLFGYMQYSGEIPAVGFSVPGPYLPIISAIGSAGERSELGWWALLLLAAAITSLAFSGYCLMVAFRIHTTLVFLSVVTFSCTLLLLHFGWRSLTLDVQNGYERFNKQLAKSTEMSTELLYQKDLSLTSSTLWDFSEALYPSLSDAERQRLNAWRANTYLVRERYLQQISQFPESVYAKVKGLAKLEEIPLTPAQRQLAAGTASSYVPTRTHNAAWLNGIIVLLSAVSAWFAFRLIRVKRIQENLPTCKTSGVSYGLTEIVGTLKPEEEDKVFRAPLTKTLCCWYNYIVQEKRGSGKNARWVTIEDRTEKCPFYCQDDEGKMRIFPGKAEIITSHKKTKYEGRYRYREKRLSPGDQLYILGRAVVDKTRGDSLVLKHEKGSPYIISNKSEKDVMLIKAGLAMAALSLTISAMFSALVFLLGNQGSFNSMDFMLACLAAPGFLIVFMIIILFNDLVFLRQRYKQAWANIQVSLKKRADLIPRLERVSKQLLEHEQSLLKQLTSLRAEQKKRDSVSQVSAYLQKEHEFITELQLVLENYPELKTGSTISKLHRSIVKLENEIAMMRAGFNDAVMQYNTRIQQFPDILLAKACNFQKTHPLRFEANAHKVPKV